MAELFKNRTSIIIAHRLSTISNADQVIVLNNGEIVEMGDHNQLLELQGFYYKMWNNLN
jgi:ABC-type transport system involved in Fe-S cluster assembly fused permease/ATPase subunit